MEKTMSKNQNILRMENDFKESLMTLKANHVTSVSLAKDPLAYNKFAEDVMTFVEGVALRSGKNRSIINVTGYESAMFADDAVMKILANIDSILKVQVDLRIAFVQQIVNNATISLWREWRRAYPVLATKNKKSHKNADQPEKAATAKVLFLDEYSWGLMPDDGTMTAEEKLVEEITALEMRSHMMEVLQFSAVCSRFELLSLLATKVLHSQTHNQCMKTRVLAQCIDETGLMEVSEMIFELAVKTFRLDSVTYFTTFTTDFPPEYADCKELAGKISKASHHGATKLAKCMKAKHQTHRWME